MPAVSQSHSAIDLVCELATVCGTGNVKNVDKCTVAIAPAMC
jgi:hypothetical protein